MIESVFKGLSRFFASLISLAKILLRSNFFLKKHTTSQSECIILGNGPSLNKVIDIYKDTLKTKNLLCVNNFPSTELFEKLQPKYFLFTSIEFFKPNSNIKNQAVRDKIIENVIKKTDWPLILFCPNAAQKNKSFVKKLKSNKNITIRYFNNTPVEGSRWFTNRFMRLGWGMPRPHNVLIPSIFVMINAGFKTINLVGADHSWIPLISVDDNNIPMVNQKHFYDDKSSTKDKMYKNNKPRKLHEILEKFMLAFKAYFVLKDYAETQKCQIYNCTPHSFIDAFDRKDLKSVLSKNT